MTVILPFHAGDRAQAQRLIAWMQQLGPQPGQFFLLTAKENQDPAMLPVGWQWMTDYLNYKSQWSQGVVDATGPNMMFQQAAREVQRMNLGPWLWLEPDAAPLCADWLSQLTAEYQRAGKPCMGGAAPTGKRMSGVAIYPQNVSRSCPKAMMTREIAFDMAGAEEFAKLGIHFTPLIADQFRCEPFKDQADYDQRVPAGTVLHHGDKTGSIIELAKARLNGVRYEPQPEVIHTGEPPKLTTTSPQEAAMLSSLDTAELVDSVAAMNGNRTGLAEMSAAQSIRHHLDLIMSAVGDDHKRRAVLYAELQKRGIEAGRKKPKKSRKSPEVPSCTAESR